MNYLKRSLTFDQLLFGDIVLTTFTCFLRTGLLVVVSTGVLGDPEAKNTKISIMIESLLK